MIKIKWNNKTIIKIIENFALAQGHNLVHLTEGLDSKLPTASRDLALWMDTINSHPGGWYHRVKHGHDFIANVGEVYEKFGIDGVLKFPYELFKDSLTTHGIPLPGTQFLVKNKIVGAINATEWLSMNITEVFTGGIAFCSTYKLYRKKTDNNLDKKDIIWASIGVGIKVVGGVASTNPILVLSGVTDTAILITDFEQAKEAFKEFFNWDLVLRVVSAGAAATIAGVGSAAGTMGAVTVLGTASTGTAISALSGVAATNAILAAIGGGSLAAGGFGVAGGIAILSGGSLIIGGVVGYGVYRLFKIKKNK